MRRREGYSAIRRRVYFAWSDVEKKPLWGLRHACTRHLRPQGSPRSRSLLRGAHIYLEFELRRVGCRCCGAVKQEKLPWLADSPFYTKRFAFFVGRRCRTTTISDVARELHLDWRAVKELDKQYMQEQLRRICKRGLKSA